MTTSRSPLVKPPLAFWWNDQHVAGAVGIRLAPLRLAGIDRDQPGELAFLAQLPGLA